MNIIKQHAFHSFASEKSFEKWLRSHYHRQWLTGFKNYKKSLDCIAVNGVLYTMEEYDSDGKTLTWGNKRTSTNLLAETSDRYKEGYSDAKVSTYPAFGTRDGINYKD